MKKLIFVSFAFALLASAVSLAQDAAQPSNATASAQAQPDPKAVKPAKTLTGCLQKGDQPGEVTLTAADGKTWDLRSDNVKLEEHIGHQVTATGTVTHETKAEEKKEGQTEKAATKEAYGDLNVTEVKMVSQTCTKQ
jgi:opacity protein-like surface antigen